MHVMDDGYTETTYHVEVGGVDIPVTVVFEPSVGEHALYIGVPDSADVPGGSMYGTGISWGFDYWRPREEPSLEVVDHDGFTLGWFMDHDSIVFDWLGPWLNGNRGLLPVWARRLVEGE